MEIVSYGEEVLQVYGAVVVGVALYVVGAEVVFDVVEV